MNMPSPSHGRPYVLAAIVFAFAPPGCLQPVAQTPAGQSGGAPSAGGGGAARPRRHNGGSGAGEEVTLAPASSHNLIVKEHFADGKSLPWTTSFSLPGDGRAYVENGELCVEIKNKGANRWDAQLRHRDMAIEKGHTYAVRFQMRATQNTRAYAKIGQSGPP